MTEHESKQPMAKQDRKVGQILLDMKLVTTQQLADAIAYQHRLKAQGNPISRIGEVLLFQKIITVQQLHDALRSQTHKAEDSRNIAIEAKKKQAIEQGLKARPKKKEPEKKGVAGFFDMFKKKR